MNTYTAKLDNLIVNIIGAVVIGACFAPGAFAAVGVITWADAVLISALGAVMAVVGMIVGSVITGR